MLICKYEKTEYASFLPHLDLLRAVLMGIRRQKIQVNFSEGFNPHARIFFTQPLPIGTQSLCEYFCVDSNSQPEDFLSKLASSLPRGISLTKAANCENKINVANLMFFADYTVKLSKPLDVLPDFSHILKSESYEIDFISKGVKKKKDVRQMIYNITADKNNLYLKLACGNINLRADRLAENLLNGINRLQDFDVIKTAMYDQNGTNLDELFFIDN